MENKRKRRGFSAEEKRKQSKLSDHIWKIKEKGEDYRLNWKILATESNYDRKKRICGLCTREKVEIIKKINQQPNRTLNKRGELFRKCLHRFKHQLGHILNGQSGALINQNYQNFVPDDRGGMLDQSMAQNLEIGVQMGQNLDQVSAGEEEGQVVGPAIIWGSTRNGKVWRTQE